MESFYGIHCTLNLMLLIFLVLLLEAEPCFDVSTVDTAVLSSLSYLETKILNRLNPIFRTILKDTTNFADNFTRWILNTWYIYIYIFLGKIGRNWLLDHA